MSDLISRQAAIEAMSRISDSICEAEAVDALCEVPTIELIRCKDCARNPNDGKARTICPCPMDRYMGDKGFCSKAMTKEEPK